MSVFSGQAWKEASPHFKWTMKDEINDSSEAVWGDQVEQKVPIPHPPIMTLQVGLSLSSACTIQVMTGPKQAESCWPEVNLLWIFPFWHMWKKGELALEDRPRNMYSHTALCWHRIIWKILIICFWPTPLLSSVNSISLFWENLPPPGTWPHVICMGTGLTLLASDWLHEWARDPG